jgi:molybdopterin converting factor small subunit
VKFFSHLRYAAGMKETDMEIDDGETLIKLIERLEKKFGSNFEEISSVNGDLNHRLSNGDVVSLLDPVGGG